MRPATLLLAVTAAIGLAASSVPVTRDEAIVIATEYVQGLHIGDVDCLRIVAHRERTPPSSAPPNAQQRLARGGFWVVTLRPLDEDCAPAYLVYVCGADRYVPYARKLP